MMGSGGMIVMDDRHLHGRCRPVLHELLARGIVRQVHPVPRRPQEHARILTRICEAEGSLEDLELLETLASGLRAAALCGLGSDRPQSGTEHTEIFP